MAYEIVLILSQYFGLGTCTEVGLVLGHAKPLSLNCLARLILLRDEEVHRHAQLSHIAPLNSATSASMRSSSMLVTRVSPTIIILRPA